MAEQNRQCLSCGYTGEMRTWLANYAAGWLTAIVLLWFFVLPGLVFIVWGWGKFKCPKCGALAKNIPFVGNALLQSRKCPFCAELIKREAIKCRFCSADLPAIEEPVCPLCHKSGFYLTDENQHYCPNCDKYISPLDSKQQSPPAGAPK